MQNSLNREALLDRAAKAVRESDALLITAGAGMGVDSGLPDFRGTEGFWKAYPVAAKLGLSFSDLANPAWFRKDPGLAWAFYGHRLNLYRQTTPHAGFHQLLELARAKPAGHFVFTSNVDGQFQKAGFDPDRIVECHGSLLHFQCATPCCGRIWSAGSEPVAVDEAAFRALPPLPRCPHCGGMARPNVLMFGDNAWMDARSQVQETHFQSWLQQLGVSGTRLTVLEFGAGTGVPTVRLTSESVATGFDARLIRFNPREPGVPPGQMGIDLGAAEGIRRVLERLARV